MKRILFVAFLIFTTITNGQKPVDYLMKGKALIKAGKTKDAVTVLTEGLEDFRQSAIYLGRAEAFVAMGDYSQAINDFNSANNLAPSSGDYGLACIYGLKGDAATAVYHLELCMRSSYKKNEKDILLDPSFSIVENRPEWRQAEIEFAVSAGNTGEARMLLVELSGIYQGNNENIYAGALINFAEKKFVESVNALSALVVEDPDNEKYLRLFARARESSGNYAGASSTYTRLLDLNVPDPELLMLRAECYRKTGETGKALDDITHYLDLYPGNKKGLSFAGKIESASGDNLQALAYFSENLKLHPNDADCYIDRANSYFISKSWFWAIQDYSMSLDLRPDNPDAWMNKGIALLNSGKTEDACHDFRKAFSLGSKKATEYISRHCIK